MAAKVIQVVQEFSLKGGVESVAFELHRAWTDMRLPTRVIVGTAPDQDVSNDIVVLKAPFHNIATRGGWAKYFGRMIVIPAFTLSATRHLKQFYNDSIILSHGDSLYGDAVIIHAVNKASIQAKRDAGNYSWIMNPMHWWVGGRDRYMIGGLRYKKYIAVSRRIAQEIQNLYDVPRERIAIIPNGVNIDRFNPLGPGRAAIRVSLGIPKNAPVLLFVGHEFERKGLSHIIAAMTMLPRDFYLIVVGNDNSEPYKEAAKDSDTLDRVIFTGPRQDLPAINLASDVFVFPSSYEAFGMVAMEALASGRPILATKTGGIEDYLVDGINGYFIERNANSIASAINLIFADKNKLQAMSNAARQTALSYSWPNIAKQYYDLLISLRQ